MCTLCFHKVMREFYGTVEVRHSYITTTKTNTNPNFNPNPKYCYRKSLDRCDANRFESHG